MRFAVLIMLACSGCFTTWAVGQASGRSYAFEEQARVESVPLPATDERLVVTLDLRQDLELSCMTAQYAREREHRSAFRYGSKWKKAMALAFVTEAALATALLLTAEGDNTVSHYAYGGFFAVDALGTAALFFAPRKEVFSSKERDVVTPVREDCPEGLLLEIAGTTYPVDAAGKIGAAGEVALDDWLKTRTGTLLVSLGGRTAQLQLGPTAISSQTIISVPVGRLTAIAE